MDENPQDLELFIARQTRKRHLAATWAGLAALQPGTVVVDIGCGPGILTLEYARIVGETGLVYAVERSPTAAEKLAAAAPGNMRVILQDYDADLNLDHLPDVIFLTDTLHHAANPEAVLKMAHRACTAETRVLITEYDPKQPGLVGAKPHRRIPRERLAVLVEAAGFSHGGAIDTADEHYALIAQRR